MFYKRGKLSLGYFNPNPVNWTHIYRISRKIGFFDAKCQKMAFSPTTQKYALVKISTGLKISTVKIFRKKLVIFFYTPYKYLSYCFITLEIIQKVDSSFLFRPHSTDYAKKIFPKIVPAILKKISNVICVVQIDRGRV